MFRISDSFIVVVPGSVRPSSNHRQFSACELQTSMAGHRVVHATLTGPSVVKELVVGAVLGLAAGTVWKMHHWNEQRKVRAFYNLLERGDITVVAEE
ncbi:OLC1v1033270C1 [Oldenlandia corymbosa var. corymbosa]|uniref:OLC1v1033270C1 n=1 Tax=Oldenlandia corymbosa var. corymbosa TaxID=529605 RepID=A0AAV1CNM3_OLDCO|nr:OLC1v1033270C1 [Oldenlandia corymbosa var. corymbosa]